MSHRPITLDHRTPAILHKTLIIWIIGFTSFHQMYVCRSPPLSATLLETKKNNKARENKRTQSDIRKQTKKITNQSKNGKQTIKQQTRYTHINK